MSKQIKLLATYSVPGGGYFSPGAIIWVDDPVADQLIANRNATYDLTGGRVEFRPSPGNGLGSGANLPGNQTISANQTADVTVPSGVTLGLVATSGISGNWAVINPDGTTATPTALVGGTSTIGVFLADTRVRFTVNTGSLTIKPGVVAGSMKSSPLYFVPIDPATGEPYKIEGGGGSGGTFDGTVTIAEGADATVGTRADAPASDPTGVNTVVSLNKAQVIASQEIARTVGPAAIGAAATKSMLIGGMYYGASAARTAGQMAPLATDVRGNLLARAYGTPTTGADGHSNSLSMFSNEQESTGGSHLLAIGGYVLNDAGTWDRLRGDTAGLRIQPAKRPGTNRSMLVTMTSQTVIPANANSWFLANDSAADILINIGAAATATDADTEGTFKLRPGERLSSRDVVETGAVNAVVASGTARLKARST